MAAFDDPETARHRAAIERERAAREARLRDPSGWLSLAGLHWLRPGSQTVGGDPACDIVLHATEGRVPAVAGTFEVGAHDVRLRSEPGAGITVAGQPVPNSLALADEQADEPTVLELASLRLVLIRRSGNRMALRVRDTASPAVREFRGLAYFAIDPAWRLIGRLLRSDTPTTIQLPDVFGVVEAAPSPGIVELEIAGQRHRLQALEAGPARLWLLFGDATNGWDSYGAGRFLVTGEVQADDTVEVDFNLAYNPPCAFTPYATCPLPPRGNRLPLRVEAGEMAWPPPTT